MLSDVKRIVEEGHLGVATYEQFAQACLQQAAAGGSDAVALFVFAKLVQPFIEYYYHEALNEARAVSFRNDLLAALNAYDAAATLEERHRVLADAIRRNFETFDS